MKKVAIVDDDSIFQFTTKVKMEKLELADEIKIFNDGEEAFDFVETADIEELPNYLFLDINMPIVDGWDFLEQYAKLSEEKRGCIKIYMLSSSINPVDVDKADADPNVEEYLIKPITDEVLLRILK